MIMLSFRFFWAAVRLECSADTTLGDGYTGQQLVQFLVITDGKLQVTRDDSGLLVIAGRVAS